ncbi:MAG: hypothetical protein AVDCRST_MAG73-2528 [uncultured Thermomicrobiales bacterium]|uniref:Response regulatory domain-containing protein n=1 Tax=uncultured Thermomicrobiales bacterium TaxID=1645740 RepID=A0A6J4UD22_9BACT|nr:MAG: hypothetical protein AVDCRST_MAG73-2528 [uncultured Thermomicrobiales bacterium]
MGDVTETTDTRSRHIVVINDTPEILALFRELLEEDGYRVTTQRLTLEMARNVSEIKELEPDLIILDYLIGDEATGWQLLQMLKMDRATRAIPIIICTGAVEQVRQLHTHLLEMGVRVVLKPFDIDHLLREIGAALDGTLESPLGGAPNTSPA